MPEENKSKKAKEAKTTTENVKVEKKEAAKAETTTENVKVEKKEDAALAKENVSLVEKTSKLESENLELNSQKENLEKENDFLKDSIQTAQEKLYSTETNSLKEKENLEKEIQGLKDQLISKEEDSPEEEKDQPSYVIENRKLKKKVSDLEKLIASMKVESVDKKTYLALKEKHDELSKKFRKEITDAVKAEREKQSSNTKEE